jgi:peptide/nickel transport system permease protein
VSAATAVTESTNRLWKTRARPSPMMFLGMVILAGLVVAALVGPSIVRQDPLAQDVSRRLEAPGHEHVLGTDRLGRDLASRLLYGARGSLTTAGAVVTIGVSIGALLGLVSGYFGHSVDFVIQRGVDVILAFPSMLLAIGIMAFMGQGLVNLILAISLVNIPQVTRLVRSRVLQLRELEFVEAARAIGAQDGYVIRRHIFPSTIGPLVVQATFILVYAIRTEASLSFIGLGIPPPDPSWGGLLDDGKSYIQTAPWMIMAPGGAIALTILGLSLIGDGLRDLLDPRVRSLMGKS